MIQAFIVTMVVGVVAFVLGLASGCRPAAPVKLKSDPQLPFDTHEAPVIGADPCSICGMPAPHGWPHRRHEVERWVKMVVLSRSEEVTYIRVRKP